MSYAKNSLELHYSNIFNQSHFYSNFDFCSVGNILKSDSTLCADWILIDFIPAIPVILNSSIESIEETFVVYNLFNQDLHRLYARNVFYMNMNHIPCLLVESPSFKYIEVGCFWKLCLENEIFEMFWKWSPIRRALLNADTSTKLVKDRMAR